MQVKVGMVCRNEDTAMQTLQSLTHLLRVRKTLCQALVMLVVSILCQIHLQD